MLENSRPENSRLPIVKTPPEVYRPTRAGSGVAQVQMELGNVECPEIEVCHVCDMFAGSPRMFSCLMRASVKCGE